VALIRVVRRRTVVVRSGATVDVVKTIVGPAAREMLAGPYRVALRDLFAYAGDPQGHQLFQSRLVRVG